MNGKFVGGLLSGILLSVFLMTCAGYYFFAVFIAAPDREAAPLSLVKDKNKISSLLNQGAVPQDSMEIILTLSVPDVLKSKVPPNFTLSAQLSGLEDKTPPLVIPVAARPDMIYRIRFPKGSPGDYRISIFLCPGAASGCDKDSARLEGRKFITYSPERPAELDIGSLSVSRLNDMSVNCFSSSTLLSGKVEATDGFLSSVSKKKLALVLLSSSNSSNTPPKMERSEAAGPGNLFYQFLPPLEQYVVYSGPLEAKKAGFAFTAPPQPSSHGPFTAVAVECEDEESYKSCALRAFPLPANFNSVSGRVHRLIGKGLVVPRCGMTDFHFYLPKFSGSSFAEPATNSLPPEFIPGVVY